MHQRRMQAGVVDFFETLSPEDRRSVAELCQDDFKFILQLHSLSIRFIQIQTNSGIIPFFWSMAFPSRQLR